MIKKLSDWFRCFVKGVCPYCESKPPNVYGCPVCEHDSNVPEKGKIKKRFWWKKYGEYKNQFSVYTDIKNNMSHELPFFTLYYVMKGKDGAVIYAHNFCLDTSDDKIIKNMMVVATSEGFNCWIASGEGREYIKENEDLLRKKLGNDYDTIYKQAFGEI